MYFHSPYYLLLLFVVLYIVWRRNCRHQRGVLFSSVAIFGSVPKTLVQILAKYVPYLLCFGIALWIVALARPQFGKEEYRVRSSGIAIMMCVDRSGSMAALDFSIGDQPINRLEAVKITFREFVAGRQDDLIGLLAFGGYVDAHCPLTLDHRTLLDMLKSIQLPQQIAQRLSRVDVDQKLLQEEGATAIGDAIAQAVDRLRDVKMKNKVIILLSDGEQNFGVLQPIQAAEIAKQFGIKIYTIGIGSNGEAPYLVPDAFGYQQRVNQMISMDEDTLRTIAETTGGQYFNARNTDMLNDVYAEIDKLEKTISEGRKYTQYSEYYRVPLAVGGLFMSLYIVCICTRFRQILTR